MTQNETVRCGTPQRDQAREATEICGFHKPNGDEEASLEPPGIWIAPGSRATRKQCTVCKGHSKLRRDLCRVNFEINNLKPFSHLAFPHFATAENTAKQLGFDGELMASARSLPGPAIG